MVALDTLLFAVFAGAAALTALMTFILFYHWVRYNPGIISTLLVMAIYTIGAAGFLLSAFGVIAQV